jgi:hypothetical protein
MKRLISVILSFYLLLGNVSFGQFDSGTRLNATCGSFLATKRQGYRGTTQQAYESGICQGFVVGVLDVTGIEELRGDERFTRLCLPSRLDQNAATEIVATYLEQHPEQRHLSGYEIVRMALAQSFRCK